MRTSCDWWPVLRLFCGMRCSDVGSENQKINQSGDFIINGQYFLFLLIGEIIAVRSLEVFLVSYSSLQSVTGYFDHQCCGGGSSRQDPELGTRPRLRPRRLAGGEEEACPEGMAWRILSAPGSCAI